MVGKRLIACLSILKVFQRYCDMHRNSCLTTDFASDSIMKNNSFFFPLRIIMCTLKFPFESDKTPGYR